MSRVPSSTQTELEGLLGQRGSLTVNSSNRALVQKWLTASGVRAVVAKGLGIESLARAYNDTTGGELNIYQSMITDYSGVKEEPEATNNENNNDVQAALQTLMQALGNANQKKPEAHDFTLTATHTKQIQYIVLEMVKDYITQPVRITIKDKVTELPMGTHKHKMFETVLKSLMCGNVAIIGPAGSGKTTLAEQCAKALNIPFYFTGAISSEYKLTGFIDAHGVLYRTAFREAYENGGLFLYDEIDASQPSAVLAFNAALANGHADFPDKSVPKHKDFYCMAAANTYWTGADRVYVGRNQLDGATLDRFIFIELDYDEKLERTLAANDDWVDKVHALRKAAREQKARVIISPRASIMGAALIHQGFNYHTTADMTVFKGMDKDAKRKLLDAVGGL